MSVKLNLLFGLIIKTIILSLSNKIIYFFYYFVFALMEEKKTVLVPVGDGCEEIETVSVVDILRRAGAEVTLASIMGKSAPLLVKGKNGITLACD